MRIVSLIIMTVVIFIVIVGVALMVKVGISSPDSNPELVGEFVQELNVQAKSK